MMIFFVYFGLWYKKAAVYFKLKNLSNLRVIVNKDILNFCEKMYTLILVKMVILGSVMLILPT